MGSVRNDLYCVGWGVKLCSVSGAVMDELLGAFVQEWAQAELHCFLMQQLTDSSVSDVFYCGLRLQLCALWGNGSHRRLVAWTRISGHLRHSNKNANWAAAFWCCCECRLEVHWTAATGTGHETVQHGQMLAAQTDCLRLRRPSLYWPEYQLPDSRDQATGINCQHCQLLLTTQIYYPWIYRQNLEG